jgi:DMSO/TMAO reductase YedYZ molybdopterin-dependent catalytic subunit
LKVLGELKLNGETLTPDHGYHCRLIVSGKLCHYRLKWIESIEIINTPSEDTDVAIVASRDDHAYRLDGLASV